MNNEIIEGNKLIADFLGITEDVMFNEDWNWLIKVIQEITKKLDLVFIRFNFFNGEIAITYRESLNSNNLYDIVYISKDEETFKLGVFTEIVNLIKFYNERKLVNR